MCERHVCLLIRAKGGGTPSGERVQSAGVDRQLVGEDGEGGIILSSPTASNRAVRAVEVVQHGGGGESALLGLSEAEGLGRRGELIPNHNVAQSEN